MPSILDPSLLPWFILFSITAFVWGTCVGSFLNVCIYRIPRELSVVRPRSHCPHCKKQIEWYQNIPIFSYLALGGRCAACRGRITPRYFLVELLVGLLFLLVWLKLDLLTGRSFLGLSPVSDWKLVPIYWVFLSGLVLGTFVDFEHLIIPDRVTLGGIVAGLVFSALAPSLHGETGVLRSLLWSGVGAAFGWGLIWAIAIVGTLIFKKEAMGFGDVKLMGAIGAFLGWQAVLFTLVVSSFFGAAVGLGLVLLRRKGMQSQIPYGPYLSLAALIWMLWGPTLLEGYLNLFLPPPILP